MAFQYRVFPGHRLQLLPKFLRTSQYSEMKQWSRVNGTDVAKEENRTSRVDKGKSGQAQKTAVSEGFGGGILSHVIKAGV